MMSRTAPRRASCFFTRNKCPPVGRIAQSTQPRAARRSGAPGAGDVARTLVDLTSQGTLCTLLPTGAPLGTAISYVLDGRGQPILRLRADALHTINLDANPVASLFVQPAGPHAARVGRLTLLGRTVPVEGALLEAAADAHAVLAAGAAGVDAPAATDRFALLRVEECFLVDHLGGASRAERLPGQEYGAAAPDALRGVAADLVDLMNRERAEDLAYIGGFYLGVRQALAVDDAILRIPFARPVQEGRDAKSALTMMAQEAWESQRPYNPVSLAGLSPPRNL
ncbi:hypothetical protein QBZ16_003887 [Prototheca wickerhamii]|uniref:Uncharacterized protein n=1 Tax=Prototheca wickerhamii TaxID=3111 RepID=A0AAD9IGG8_PROWI|nr:hypothetical protein QBZ16_003887 [Prototheca wickerhamii]